MHFPNIARLTKRLGVTPIVFASAHNWNDVVQNKFMFGIAPSAGARFPFSALHRCKVSAVTLEFPRFVIAKMGETLKHFVSIISPTFPKGCAHFFSGFCGLFIATQLFASPLTASRSFPLLDAPQSVCVMGLSPKRIIGPSVRFAPAFRILAGHSSMAALEVMPGDVKHCSANKTGNFLTSFYVGHGNSYIGVNSVETPLYALSVKRAIPSQARQEWREGVTTRAWSPERTVKPHERTTRKGRDSLSLLGIVGNADKEPRDNTTDETLNVGENSPISAAQYSIAQYAGAVTMSGLQMLQNSGKEAIIDLMEGRLQVTEKQLMNRIDYDLYQDGTGNGGKNLTGLAAAIADTPTSGTYGGIDRGLWSFWQNQFYRGVTDGGAAVSAANIQAYMTTLALRCVRGSDMPDLWIGSTNYYSFYVNSLQAIQRITSSDGDTKAGAGFPTLAFSGGGMNAKVVLGGGINGAVNTAGTTGGEPTSHMYAINTDYLFFRPHRDRNFVPIGGERQSVNQDAIVKLIGWAGNLTSCGPQFCGVLEA